MIAHRIEKLAAALEREQLDALIVVESGSRYYLTGWSMFDAQAGETAYFVLADKQGTTIFCGSNDVVEAQAAAPASQIVSIIGPARWRAMGEIAKRIVDGGYKRVGYDEAITSAAHYLQLRKLLPEDIELVPATDLVREIRAVKEPGEIELIKEAIRITDDAYMAMLDWIRPGVTEAEAAWFLDRHMRDHGADGFAFKTILAGGPGGAVPHHEPTGRALREGEPCWVDFGATVNGYCADMTRTFCLGTPGPMVQEVYDAVIAALDAGIALLRAGTDGREAAKAAYYEIESRGLPCGHALGHGIGLQVHELPSAHPGGGGILEENMIVTAEPGVYFPNWGGVRVEDDVLITADGPVILNRADRRLVV